jgi:hypothetical protein
MDAVPQFSAIREYGSASAMGQANGSSKWVKQPAARQLACSVKAGQNGSGLAMPKPWA